MTYLGVKAQTGKQNTSLHSPHRRSPPSLINPCRPKPSSTSAFSTGTQQVAFSLFVRPFICLNFCCRRNYRHRHRSISSKSI
ncbi:hypothetical protein L6452_40328 [Arctium lappa]|uniref:Uncharacterized protein n=1 Tax=Arctium lappa TaxID=4217 RepID=A0ACB8XLU6_ARCLA|nr:hypothetical protein L6452_40328 [Arctium lappa]